MNINSINARLNAPNERLRFLRSLTNLTRKDIAEKYNLPTVTLNKWETGSLSLSDKGIIKCLNIYKCEGVIATEDWIKSGDGPLPYIMNSSNKLLHQGEYKNFENDINYYKNTYSNCVVFEINGDEMLPTYKSGDIVIGYIYTNDYKYLNNKICIITLENNEQLLRKLLVVDNNQYNLHCINPLTTAKESILFNVTILQIAPVIWHGMIDAK